jgi:DNA-binding response OmpR family regulator
MTKILAIDDELDFTSTLERYFSPRGYQVLVASRADKGIILIEQENPDVILMDLKMPGLDGDIALKEIIKRNPNAKVIMVTAFQDEGKTRARVMEAGAFAYVEKPVPSLKELESMVRAAVKTK